MGMRRRFLPQARSFGKSLRGRKRPGSNIRFPFSRHNASAFLRAFAESTTAPISFRLFVFARLWLLLPLYCGLQSSGALELVERTAISRLSRGRSRCRLQSKLRRERSHQPQLPADQQQLLLRQLFETQRRQVLLHSLALLSRAALAPMTRAGGVATDGAASGNNGDAGGAANGVRVVSRRDDQRHRDDGEQPPPVGQASSRQGCPAGEADAGQAAPAGPSGPQPDQGRRSNAGRGWTGRRSPAPVASAAGGVFRGRRDIRLPRGLPQSLDGKRGTAAGTTRTGLGFGLAIYLGCAWLTLHFARFILQPLRRLQIARILSVVLCLRELPHEWTCVIGRETLG
ncbi:hypothetical protein HPB51_022802 [Rhipicephalus microplus]|uniref:Transmembrane protein n=1 Tax=Rhipicephalus microplus TaxID=6941 RepID=A0A9J6ECH4_RHIMP|nr:hypothetical protein HPB51_022802 [Rhipicephalus microplus]